MTADSQHCKTDEWKLALTDPDTPDHIWTRMAEGETLREICKARHWPRSIVQRWIDETPERIARYNLALKDWGDALGQEAVIIARNTELGKTRRILKDGSEEVTESDMLGHRKLKIETFLKLAAKYDRQRYGDSVAITGAGGGPLEFRDMPDDIEIARRLAFVLDKAQDTINKAAESAKQAVSVEPSIPQDEVAQCQPEQEQE